MFQNKKILFAIAGVLFIGISMLLFLKEIKKEKEAKNEIVAENVFNGPRNFMSIKGEGRVFVLNEKDKSLTEFDLAKGKDQFSKIKFESFKNCKASGPFPGKYFNLYVSCLDEGKKRTDIRMFNVKLEKPGYVDLRNNNDGKFELLNFFTDQRNNNTLFLVKYFDSQKNAILILNPMEKAVPDRVNLNDLSVSNAAVVVDGKLVAYDFISKGIVVFDFDKKEVIKKIPIDRDVDPEFKFFKVGNSGRFIYLLEKDRIDVADIYSGKVESILIDGEAILMKLDEKNNKIYVISAINKDSNGKEFFSIINLDNKSVLSKVEIGRGSESMFFDKEYIYIGSKTDNSVFVVKIDDGNKIFKKIPSGGISPVSLLINGFSGELYVANFESNNIGIIDLKSKELVRTFPETKEAAAFFERFGIFFIALLAGIISIAMFLFFQIRGSHSKLAESSEQGNF